MERKKAEAAERTGTLKARFATGYGFIADDGGGRDVVVRQADVPPECWELGQRLRFRALPPIKGKSLCATDVRAEG